MTTLHFGTALYYSKGFAGLSSTTSQKYKVEPTGSDLYTTCAISGIISGRPSEPVDYRYGATLAPLTTSIPTYVYNGNGAELHPIITFATTKTLNSYERYLAGGPAGSTMLNIYKGTKPTSADNISNLNNYSSDLLISFPMPAGISGIKCLTHDMYNAQNLTINSTYKNPGVVSFLLGICTNRTTAVATGTATWFWFGNSSNPTDLSDIAFVVGGIGSVDDGNCEMVIDNPNISAGEQYISGGFKFTFPSIITF